VKAMSPNSDLANSVDMKEPRVFSDRSPADTACLGESLSAKVTYLDRETARTVRFLVY
jgi:hypothetical protein